MVSCWVEECKHRTPNSKCSFFRIPSDKKRRNKWLQLLRRTHYPYEHKRVCSCHFEQGNKQNLPTLLLINSDKRFGPDYLNPEKQRTRINKSIQADKEDLSNKSEPNTDHNNDMSIEVKCEPAVILESNKQIVSNIEEYAEAPSISEIEAVQTTNVRLETESIFAGSSEPINNTSLKPEYIFIKTTDLIKSSKKLCLTDFEDDERVLKFYTGMENKKIIYSLINLIKAHEIKYYKFKVTNIKFEDQILITLMKLRRNFSQFDLAYRFSCSQSTVSNIVTTFIYVLNEILVDKLMAKIPSLHENQIDLPKAFERFPNCRIIIDSTEIYVDAERKSINKPDKTSSSYKYRNILKGLVGVAPNGVVTFVSDLYAGHTSDKQIVKESKVLDQLEAGDLVLAGKGFSIQDLMPEGTFLNISSTSQSTADQTKESETIAKAKLHVERAIRRIKSFKILDKIPFKLIPHSSVVFKVCGALNNFQYNTLVE